MINDPFQGRNEQGKRFIKLRKAGSMRKQKNEVK
jgi:hypothetical protein